MPRRGSPAGSPPSAVATSPTRASARFSVIPRLGRAVASSASPCSIRAAVFGPIPGTLSSRPSAAASRSCGSVLIPSAWPSSRIRFAETPSSARDADELGQRLRLELVQLGDAAGLDELPQPRLDARPDAGQLPRPSLPDECGHVGRRRADQVGRAAVRAHGVVAGAVQVEQGREGLEALGEGCVVHD